MKFNIQFYVLLGVLFLLFVLHWYKKSGKIKTESTHSHTEQIHAVHLPHDRHLYGEFQHLSNIRAPAGSWELMSVVQQLLDPPAVRRFKTCGGKLPKWTPLEEIAFTLLNNKTKGFFVEVGAFDGLHASNTLHLEQEKQWEGLLIEADPDYYVQLRGHNRKAWSINAGIGVEKYAQKLSFWEDTSSGGGQGGSVDSKIGWRYKSSVISQGGDTTRKAVKTQGLQVPAIPLETMLLALDRRRVDYFSLDIEGNELEVLKTIPFDKFDIRVLSVEFVHGGFDSKRKYIRYMESVGYRLYREVKYAEPPVFVQDLIFVKDST